MAKGKNTRTISLGLIFNKGNFDNVIKSVVKNTQWAARQLAVFGLAGSAIEGAFNRLSSVVSTPLKLAAANEAAAASFEVLLGSAEKATVLIKQLKDYGAATPFEFTDLQDAAKTMLSFGVAADSIMPSLDMLANVASGDAQKLKSLALVFGQISANGKLTGGDLLQLVNAGFNPLNEIAKKTGETMTALRDRMSKGKIGFQEVSDAFKAATSAGGLFYGMNEKQSKTLTGLWSTMWDNINVILADVGDMLIRAFDLKEILGQSGKLSDVWTAMRPVFKAALDQLVNLVHASIAFGQNIKWLIQLAVGITTALMAYAAAQRAVAMATAVAQAVINPALAVKMAVGLAAGAAAAYGIGKAMDGFTAEATKANNEAKEMAKYMDSLKPKVEQVGQAATVTAVAVKDELAEAIKEANEDAAKLVETLQDEIKYFGMSTEEAKIWKLAQEGASEAVIQQAWALYDQLEAMKAVQKAKEDQIEADKKAAEAAKEAAESQMKSLKDRAKAIYEDTRTPFEKYQEQLKEINRLMNTKDENGNPILDKDTAVRAAQKAKAEFEDETKPKDKPDNKPWIPSANMAKVGSVEDYRLLVNHYQGNADPQKQIAKTTKEQLAEQKKTNEHLKAQANKKNETTKAPLPS